MRAPVFKVYGEELDFVFTEVRKKGCRRLMIDGKPVDISAEVVLDESKVRHMDAVVDRCLVNRKHEKAIKAGIAAALLVGDGLMQVHIVKGASKPEAERFYRGLCSATHHCTRSCSSPTRDGASSAVALFVRHSSTTPTPGMGG